MLYRNFTRDMYFDFINLNINNAKCKDLTLFYILFKILTKKKPKNNLNEI